MFLMLQKTFFASKGTKNLVEYPKPGRDFSTKRVENGAWNDGPARTSARTQHAEKSARQRPSAGRQAGKGSTRGTPGRARRHAPGQGIIEGEARSMRKPARQSHQSGWRKRTPHGRSPAQKRTPHGRNPAQGKAPHKQEKIPHGRMSRIEKKPRPREYFARKKSRTKGTRPGDRFAHEKIPRGSGKYQR